MVSCDGYGCQDGWFGSLEELVDTLEEKDDEVGEPLPWPEFCFAATKEVRKLDVSDAINEYLGHLCEDGYEDMDIEPSAELIAAAEKFNAENEHELTCWRVDSTRKIRIHRREKDDHQ